MYEIERKYIVDPASPALHRALTTAGSGDHIRQGYVIAAGATGELRLRSRNGRHTMTVKRGTPPQREEYEVDVPTELFEQLWPATDGCRVKKRRWHIRYGELDVELDAFDGALQGLWLAEIEFPSLQDAKRAGSVESPAWLGPEVTHDKRFTNQALAQASAPPTVDEL